MIYRVRKKIKLICFLFRFFSFVLQYSLAIHELNDQQFAYCPCDKSFFHIKINIFITKDIVQNFH